MPDSRLVATTVSPHLSVNTAPSTPSREVASVLESVAVALNSSLAAFTVFVVGWDLPSLLVTTVKGYSVVASTV